MKVTDAIILNNNVYYCHKLTDKTAYLNYTKGNMHGICLWPRDQIERDIKNGKIKIVKIESKTRG